MSATLLEVLLFVDKAGLYGAVLLAIGAGLHSAFGIVGERRHSKILIGGALAGLLLALGRLVVTSAQLGNAATAFDSRNLALAWLTQGASVMALGFGAALTAAAATLNRRWLYLAAAAALSSSFALTGHAQGVISPLLTPIAVVAHVLIAGFWVTAPLSLWPAPEVDTQALAPRVERFSSIAIIAIPILFALGLALLLRLAGSLAAIFASDYGRLLLAKLAAAVCALCLGGYNKLVVSRRLRDAAPGARRRLKATLVGEAVAFTLALLLLAAATTFTGPDL